jgi:hypothetical protein
MAFTAKTFIPTSAQGNSNASRIFSYTTADTIATVKAANYFDSASATSGGLGLTDGDVIIATASDGTSFIQVSVTAGAATTALANNFL